MLGLSVWLNMVGYRMELSRLIPRRFRNDLSIPVYSPPAYTYYPEVHLRYIVTFRINHFFDTQSLNTIIKRNTGHFDVIHIFKCMLISADYCLSECSKTFYNFSRD